MAFVGVGDLSGNDQATSAWCRYALGANSISMVQTSSAETLLLSPLCGVLLQMEVQGRAFVLLMIGSERCAVDSWEGLTFSDY
jgi:hypothetical protein